MAIKPRDNTIPPINDGKSNRRHGTISGFTVVDGAAVVVVGVVVDVVVVGVVVVDVVGTVVGVVVSGCTVVVVVDEVVDGVVVGAVVVSLDPIGTAVVAISGAAVDPLFPASVTVPVLISEMEKIEF